MKLSVSAYQAGSSSAQKILSQASHTHHVVPQHLHHGPLHGVVANYGSTSSTPAPPLIIPRVQAARLIPAVMVEEVDGRSSPGADGGPSGAAGEDGDGGGRDGVAGPAGEGASGTGGGSGSQQPSAPAAGGGHSDMVDSTFGRQTAVRPPPETTSPSASASTASSASAKGKGAGKRPPPPTTLPHAPREGRRGEEAEEGGRKGDGGGKKSSDKSPGLRTKSNQRWMKLRTTVQLSGAISSTIQKKPPLKREDSFLKRFSTRQIPETQETMDTGDDGDDGGSSSAGGGGGGGGGNSGGGRGCGGGGVGSSSHPASDERRRRRRRVAHHRRRQVSPRSVINPDENFYFYWLFVLTACVLYNLWTLIVRQSFPELQAGLPVFWRCGDAFGDTVFLLDVAVQFRTGYLEQGLMVYDSKKLAAHYISSKAFLLDLFALTPLDLVQLSPKVGPNPILRFPRFLKMYRLVDYYYMVESRTVYPNLWRVVNLVHILLILAHWFGCFYYLLSEAEGFQGDWVYPHRLEGDYATLTRKYLGSLYWSTLTLTTIGDLPTPETNADGRYRKAFSTLILPYTTTAPPTPLSPPHHGNLSSYLSANSSSTEPANTTTATATSAGNPQALPRRGLKSRLLQFSSNRGYVFTIVSYLIGVFIFATIVGQVGNVITNRNANRLEFERLLDGAKTYMRHHKVPGDMKRRVLRWYDYSWSRGRIQGGGDINTALGLLPDKLKTELALHVNLSVLKKVTIFQECQPEFLHDLVLKMKAYIFTPGDLICRKGEVAREMFIIADGILEVMSETGRVLTTMKAGDFFGEIGILNLDGLNKRTADVRSVGYSELFSLSREDVLAAMKDYPEAQEILQALGRKRLMEARNSGARGGSRKGISRSSTKAPSTPSPASTKSSPPALGKGHSKDEIQIENEKEKTPGMQWQESTSSSSPALLAGTPGENTGDADGAITGKKIVERLKSDVMGLREVLRKSKRIATRGMRDEAIELQPLTKETPSSSSMTTGSSRDKSPQLKALLLRSLTSKHTGNWDSSCSGIKGALRRMSHVKSDDSGGDVGGNSKSSPPELPRSSQRKRSRGRGHGSEEPEEEDEDDERKRGSEESEQKVEVIGEGLPLITRLRMLREKEERERKLRERRRSSSKESEGEKAQGEEPQGSKGEEQEVRSKPVEVIGEGLPLFTRLRMLREKEEREAAAAAAAAEKKAAALSEREVREGNRRKSSSTSSGASQTSPPPIPEAEEKEQLSKPEEKPPTRAVRPLIQRLLLLKAREEKEKESEPGVQPSASAAESTLPPSSTSSSAGVPSMTAACSESQDSAPNVSSAATTSQISVAVVPPRTRDLQQSECKGKPEVTCMDNSCSDLNMSKCCEGSMQEASVRTDSAQISSAQTSAEDSVSINQDAGAQSMCASETSSIVVQVEDDEGELVVRVSEEPDKELCSVATDRRQEFRSSKSQMLPLRRDKNYASIDDLSPEYCGLPFVKKLKILNDRQRLAELDKSSSLDSGDCVDRIDPCHRSLSRSFSDASYISHIGPTSAFFRRNSPHTNSIVPRGKSNCDEENVVCSQRTEDEDLRNLSPESNETLERQNLKSILKKLSGSIAGDDEMTKTGEGSLKSEEKTTTLGATKKDLHQLMRAPTVEGYAARHSKLTKSVTFNRDTLPSPPRTPTAATISPGIPVLHTPDLATSAVQEKSHAEQEPFLHHYSTISTARPTSLSSALDNRHFLVQGATDSHSTKEDECFGGVLLGIKQVIQSHVDEIQSRFQEKFLSLESEVKKRDEIIFFLEKRISELEQPNTGTRTNGNTMSVEDDSTSSSDDVNPFMRGDSADTVVTADLEDDIDVDDCFDNNSLDQGAIVRQRGKKSCKRKSSHSLSEEASQKEDDDIRSAALSLWLSDRDEDLKMSYSSTSSSSSFTSSSPSSSPSSSSQEENDDIQMPGRNKDWEVQMLARELERRQGVKRLKEYDEQCDKAEKAGEEEEEEFESHHRLARRFLRLSRSERELLERLLGSEEDADEEEPKDKVVSDSAWHQSRSLKQLRKKTRKGESRRKGAGTLRKKNGTKVKGSPDSKVAIQGSCQETDAVGEYTKRKVWIGQQVLNARSLEESGSASSNIPSSSTSRRRAASTGQLPFLLPLPSLSALSNSFRGIAKAATAGMGQVSSQIPEPDPEKAVVTISGSGHSSSDCPLDTTVVSKPSPVPKL
ncbi:uncharacterized protein [Hetaerina americana]|uniref:uncharacterized protein n=1 Tax=Hetaerina americana TaxID=62018 RepID=UPI003A7F263B